MRVYYVVTMVPAALQVTRNTLRANNMLDQLKEDWSAIDLWLCTLKYSIY